MPPASRKASPEDALAFLPNFVPLIDNSSDADTLLEQTCQPAPIRLAKEIVVERGVPLATTCPQCGAILASDHTCRDRFNTTQMMELGDPAYYAVHHLSVVCYMLQHNGYSGDGWVAVRQLLHQFVYAGLSPTQARRQNRRMWDSGQRRWSLTKGSRLTQINSIVWTRTVADVRIDTAEHYCADVREWAVAVLADTAALIKGLDNTNLS